MKKHKIKKWILLTSSTIIGASILAPILFANQNQVLSNTISLNDYKTVTQEPGVQQEGWELLSEEMYTTKEVLAPNFPINTSNSFALTNGSSPNNFWSFKLSNVDLSYSPTFSNFNNRYEFSAPQIIIDKLSASNIANPNQNLLNFTLYSNLNNNYQEIPSNALLPEKYVQSKEQQQLHGYSFDDLEFRKPLFPDTNISSKNPYLLVSSKFYYGDDPTYKPLPNVISNNAPTPIAFDYTKGLYDEPSKFWFSSGYFVHHNNSISYFVPNKTQENSDITLDKGNLNNPDSNLLKRTANEFMQLIKNDSTVLKNELTLTVKNGLPGLKNGQIWYKVDNAEGKIHFKYKWEYKVKVTQHSNSGAFIQDGIEHITQVDEKYLDCIDGFYTNTTIIEKSPKIKIPIKDFAPSEYLGQIDLVKRIVYELKDIIWSQLPYGFNKNNFEGWPNNNNPEEWLIPDNKNKTLKVQIKPTYKLQDGEKVENTGDELNVTITFTDFQTKIPTEFHADVKNREKYPSYLQGYFDEVKDTPDELKTRLNEFVKIEAEPNDLPNIVINSVTVEEHNDLNGTARLKISASNCRLEDEAIHNEPKEYIVELSDLLKVSGDTTIETEYTYQPEIQGDYTVEKFIYDLKNDETIKNNFIDEIKNNIVKNAPIDVEPKITKPNGNDKLIWYSNKEKYLNLKIELNKYIASSAIVTKPKEQIVRINLPNAQVPVAPTRLDEQITLEGIDQKYADQVTEEDLQQSLWNNLCPTNENDLDNILKYPRGSNGEVLSSANIMVRIIKKDIAKGELTFKYYLNTYYDVDNLNTIRHLEPNDFTEPFVNEKTLTGFKKPNVTSYNEQVAKEINIPGFNQQFANAFNDQENVDIKNAIKNHINLGGNIEGTDIAYTIDDPKDNNNSYNGKLIIDVTLNNAWVFDEANTNGNYIKQENKPLGKFTITGFKKFAPTSFISDEGESIDGTKTKTISIKALKPDNDTTANNIEWTQEKLLELIIQKKDQFFNNLPIDFDKPHIRIDNIVWKSVDENQQAIDNPYISFDVHLSNYLQVNGDQVSVNTTPKKFGTIILTGFRKAVPTQLIQSVIQEGIQIPGLGDKIAQDANSNFTNFEASIKKHIFDNRQDIFNSIPSIIEDDITLKYIPDSWNNKEGQIEVEVSLNKYYGENGILQLTSNKIGKLTIKGFKKVVHTQLKPNVSIQAASNLVASKVNEEQIKDIIVKNIANILVEDSYLEKDINLENISFDGSVPNNQEGSIQINGLKLKNYFQNDNKCTYSNLVSESFGNITITGFQQVKPTELSKQELIIDGLSQFVSQQSTLPNKKNEIITIIKQYILANQNDIFNVLPDRLSTEDDITVEIPPEPSFNNKEGTIEVSLKIKKYYDENSNEQLTLSKPFGPITIKGFTPVVAPTDVVSEPIETGIQLFPDAPDLELENQIKAFIVNEPDKVFTNLPIHFLEGGKLSAQDFELVKSSSTQPSMTEGIVTYTIKLKKYYKDTPQCEYVAASIESDYLSKEVNFRLGKKYIPTQTPDPISPIELSGIQISNQDINEYLAQDLFTHKAIDPTLKQAIQAAIANKINKSSQYTAENGLELKPTDILLEIVPDSANNINGSIMVNNVTIINNKWINQDGIKETSYVLNGQIEVKGFKKVEQTQFKKELKDLNNLIAGGKYANLYPQQILEDQQFKTDLQTWINDNFFTLFENTDSTPNNEVNLAPSAAPVYTLSLGEAGTHVYSNKEGWIQFSISMTSNYIFSGEKGLYGNGNGVNQDIKLFIGTAVPGPTSINGDFKLNLEEVKKKYPSEFGEKDIDVIAKNWIVNQLVSEQQNDQITFLQSNSLFKNLPVEWKTFKPEQLKQMINIEHVSSNDDNGTMSFKISISNAPFFVEEGNDVRLTKFTTPPDDETIMTLSGFRAKDNTSFPLVPVILGSLAILVLIVIICLTLYYIQKKKKYKTITVANENELKK